MKTLLLITAAAAALISATAAAQTYVTANGGLTVPNDPSLRMETNTLNVQLDDGYAFGIGAGYDFGRVRVEIEASRARASVARISDARRSFNYPEGSQSRWSGMINAYLDQPLSRAVTLYGGGGVGIASMQMRAKGGPDCREELAVRIVHDDPNIRQGEGKTCKDQGDSRETGLGWQAMAGFDFAAGGGWGIGPQFRYYAATGIRTAGKSLRTRETEFTTDRTYTSLNALISVRKSF